MVMTDKVPQTIVASFSNVVGAMSIVQRHGVDIPQLGRKAGWRSTSANGSVARITVAHFTVADFTDPTKKWLPNLPLPNFPVAQFTVAHFTVYPYPTPAVFLLGKKAFIIHFTTVNKPPYFPPTPTFC